MSYADDTKILRNITSYLNCDILQSNLTAFSKWCKMLHLTDISDLAVILNSSLGFNDHVIYIVSMQILRLFSYNDTARNLNILTLQSSFIAC